MLHTLELSEVDIEILSLALKFYRFNVEQDFQHLKLRYGPLCDILAYRLSEIDSLKSLIDSYKDM